MEYSDSIPTPCCVFLGLRSSVAIIGISTSQGGGLLETIYFFHPWQLYSFPFRWKANVCSWYILTLPCPSDRRCRTVSIAFQHVFREWASGWRRHYWAKGSGFAQSVKLINLCVCVMLQQFPFLLWASIALFKVGSSAQFNQSSSWTIS